MRECIHRNDNQSNRRALVMGMQSDKKLIDKKNQLKEDNIQKSDLNKPAVEMQDDKKQPEMYPGKEEPKMTDDDDGGKKMSDNEKIMMTMYAPSIRKMSDKNGGPINGSKKEEQKINSDKEEVQSFDKENATQRLKATDNATEFPLVDSDGKPIKYGLKEIFGGNRGAISLPEGTLVSKLDPNPKYPNYIHVIAWHNMKYREGYVNKSAFTGKYEGGSPKDVEVFIDDAYHTVHRAEVLMKEIEVTFNMQMHRPKVNTQVEHLQKILDSVKTDLKANKKGDLKITKEILDQVKQEDQEALKINLKDKPESMQRISSSIFEKTNPVTNEQQKLSDTALFVPLTDTWFQTDDILKNHFENVIQKDMSSNLTRIISDTGEGIEIPEDINAWFSEFEVLRKLIKGRPIADSPEGKWLFSITPDYQKRIKRMIFIGGQAWSDISSPKSKYSSSVALTASFGPIQANPMQLLMMHELNVNSNSGFSLMGEDSHVKVEETETAWDDTNKGNFFKKIAPDNDRLDDLFQSQSGIALTMLYGYMQKIKAKQSDNK